MAAPYEIVAGPLTLYLAPVATAFPDIDEPPDVAWVKVGTAGTKNYDGGVTVNQGQTIQEFVPAGGTMPRKAFREEEALEISCTLVDLSPLEYARALNNATITTVAASAGVAGQKHFSLVRGIEIATFALLARGKSTVNDALTSQFELPMVYENGSPSPVFEKGGPAMLELNFKALEDPTTPPRLRIQTAVAS